MSDLVDDTVSLASYKDLCIDAVDPLLLGRFWAAALGREMMQRDDGLVVLDGPTPRHRIWVNPVPEAVTVKQRVHLDIHALSHEDTLALGATALDVTSFPWQVLRDPEGGELCVFERGVVPEERLYEVVVDCADPHALAEWWADVIGGRVDHDDEHGVSSLEEVPGMPFEFLVFGAVPEPKTVKNRIHWDIDVPTVDLLVAHGARVVRSASDEVAWTVLVDPAGNEFCAFQSG